MLEVRANSRTTCAAAAAAVAAARETVARARQHLIDLRKEVQALSKGSEIAVAATKEALVRVRRVA
jgi:hypothetical protein